VKPVVIILIAISTVLVVGALATASFTMACRSETRRESLHVWLYLDLNYWGDPLWATMISDDPYGLSETGPYPNYTRHGRWVRREIIDGKEVQSEHWYLDDQVVTREEWENR
jgi:hypothetical protein